MKILITGKNSYIGTSFEKWVKQYGDTYLVDTIDVRDDVWKQQSFAGYDAILHVAGIAHIKETPQNSQLYYKVNRDLAIDLAVKAKQDGARQFVFLSSMSVYGIEQGVITKETHCNPKNSYGKAKLEAEEIIHKLQNVSFSVAILRPPMVYGKGCRGNYPRLARLAIKTPIFPDVDNKRSMIHIDNLSEFIKQLIDNQSEGLFFPQNEKYVNTSEMVRLIAEAYGRRVFMTKLFNPILKLVNVSTVNKVFGDLIYDMSMSDYKSNYRVYEFKESLQMTEEKL